MDRRRYLSALLSVTLLSGCGCLSDQDSLPEQQEPRDDQPRTTGGTDTETKTDPRNPTDSKTETPTDEEILNQTHSAEELESVVQELEQDTATLNFKPADPDADYSNSNVYEQFNGELTVELDLDQAIQQRHHDNVRSNSPIVEEFVNNINDPEWRQQILEEGDVDDQSIDWEIYTDESLSYGERMRESNMIPFWYVFEEERFGGVSSTNNQYKAQALQGAEKEAGFDTFIWDYGIPGHGLVSAIENPTRSDGETDKQETYIIETSFAEGQQVVKWENSQYRQSELHPAREGVDRHSEGFYSRTGGGKDEYQIDMETDSQMTDEFIEFFRNPESHPAQEYLEPMAAAAYIAEENKIEGDENGVTFISSDEIEYRL